MLGHEVTKGKIILLNAPPLAGKDTIANKLREVCNMAKMEFKFPLYKIAAAITGHSVEKFLELYAIRELKENPCPEFLGMSGRQLLIEISEDFCKPRFGKTYFGRVAANSMSQEIFENFGYVFSDSGFYEEILPLAEKFDGPNIFVFKFAGQGKDSFATASTQPDSRNFIREEDVAHAGINVIPFINNDSTPEFFVNEIVEYLRNF